MSGWADTKEHIKNVRQGVYTYVWKKDLMTKLNEEIEKYNKINPRYERMRLMHFGRIDMLCEILGFDVDEIVLTKENEV